MYRHQFAITIEVVPPVGPKPDNVLNSLEALVGLPINGFSVATNPVAKPRMSAMAVCAMIQQRTKKPAILHLTTRDHNRLSLQSEIWGAMALGIDTVMVATGDLVAYKDHHNTTTVRDTNVYGLINMAREAGLETGVVFDAHPESNGLPAAVTHLKRKVDAGAQFAVTQPVYDSAGADEIAEAITDVGIPIIMGILPLRTARHAEFLHTKVSGITVPETLRNRMHQAEDPIVEGIVNAREMVNIARQQFSGACIMPPFDHYEVLSAILEK